MPGWQDSPGPPELAPWLRQWRLLAQGPAMRTRGGLLLPVLHQGAPAMLKLASDADGCRGGAWMQWWQGHGAAPVLARDGAALLMRRATGPRDLARMARAGEDDEACRVLCRAAQRLHAARHGGLPDAVPLALWFRDLAPAAAQGGPLARSAAAARGLLASPRDEVPLHGDLHHGNVLDFGDQGWLAIDPKGLRGERGFDFAPLFLNPDLAEPAYPIARMPGRFAQRLAVVAEAARLERGRLLLWVLAWAGLSALWNEDEQGAAIALSIASLAAAALDGRQA